MTALVSQPNAPTEWHLEVLDGLRESAWEDFQRAQNRLVASPITDARLAEYQRLTAAYWAMAAALGIPEVRGGEHDGPDY